MNNDLISRSELKKALKSNCDTLCNDKNTNWCEHCCPLNDFEDLIDNAPAVITDSLYEAYCKMNDEEFEHTESFTVKTPKGKTVKFIKERPQGEWIDYDNTFYKCPDCGYLLEKCCPQCQNKVILPKGGAE